MGLTNDNPKVAVATVVALAEMAKGFELFRQYGIEKLVADANRLSETEERKAKEARDGIARNEALVAELKQRQKQLDDISAQHVQTVQSLNEERARLAKREAELHNREKELGIRDEENRKTKESLNQRERAVEVAESKAAQETEKATATRKEAERILADVKARADKMKGLTEGL